MEKDKPKFTAKDKPLNASSEEESKLEFKDKPLPEGVEPLDEATKEKLRNPAKDRPRS